MTAQIDPFIPHNRPLNRLPAEDRYMRDPLFHTLVESLYVIIKNGEMTPTEVREAAMLAAVKYEMELPFPRRPHERCCPIG